MDGTLLYDGDCGFCTTTVGWLPPPCDEPGRGGAVAARRPGGARASPARSAPTPCSGCRTARGAVGPDAVRGVPRAPGPAPGRGGPAAHRSGLPPAGLAARPVRLPPPHPPPDGILASQLQAPDLARPAPRRPQDLPGRLLRVVHGDDRYPLHWPDRPREFLLAPACSAPGSPSARASSSATSPSPRSRRRRALARAHRPCAGDEIALVSRLFVRARVRGTGYGAALLRAAVTTSDVRPGARRRGGRREPERPPALRAPGLGAALDGRLPANRRTGCSASRLRPPPRWDEEVAHEPGSRTPP